MSRNRKNQSKSKALLKVQRSLGIRDEHNKKIKSSKKYKKVIDESLKDIKKDDETFKKMIEESEKMENKELTLTIESWGQMNAKDIFIKAIEALNTNLKDFVKQVK